MVYLHSISPVALDLGFFKIHWYGVMYLISFLIGYFLVLSRRERLGWKPEDVSDFLFWSVIAILIGGRVGYMVFYQPIELVTNPLSLFKIWQGGMSFHGGVLGMAVAFIFYARRKSLNPFDLSDFILPVVGQGLAFGRLGNFINGELWGKPTQGDWGVVFPQSDSLLPRHPTQLYEMLLEGIVLFIILWLWTVKPRPRMTVTGLFLLLYGVFRSLVEFWRLPDEHIGYVAFGWVTQGQLLTLPMIIAGFILIYYGYRKNVIYSRP